MAFMSFNLKKEHWAEVRAKRLKTQIINKRDKKKQRHNLHYCTTQGISDAKLNRERTSIIGKARGCLPTV